MSEQPELRDRDHVGALRAAYQAWLQTERPGAEVVRFDPPSETGFSSETIVCEVAFDGTAERQVLRTTPSKPGVFRDYDLDAQVRWLRAMAGTGEVPVPAVPFHEADPAPLGRPFYVMEFVEGLIPPDNPPFPLLGWLKDADPAVQETIYRRSVPLLAAVHRQDPIALGLLRRRMSGAEALQEQLAWWRELHLWASQGTQPARPPVPTIDAAFDWLDRYLPQDPGPAVPLWGDARISNMVFAEDGTPRALLDWEMATVAPAEVDLGWYLYMERQFTDGLSSPRLPGFPGEDELIAIYEDAAGRSVGSLEWYLVFSGLRFSILMARIASQVIASGQLPADSDVERNNLASRLLAATLDLPSPGEPGAMG